MWDVMPCSLAQRNGGGVEGCTVSVMTFYSHEDADGMVGPNDSRRSELSNDTLQRIAVTFIVNNIQLQKYFS
jgi:hypothetical protein